ncbi:O-antigen ligase family protein [Subtercola boreus]|uniref:O-antigen ligase family protein n=1 Tax=Subtercola boreus TaxID=120213 RepID=UPI0015598053|nr:O-antigen ligase family protein [Subtercola boreus]
MKLPTVRVAGTCLLLAMLAAALIFGALTLTSRLGSTNSFVLIVGGAVVVALCCLPKDWLPSAALAIFLVVPRVALSENDFLNTITPSFIILVVWYARSIFAPRPEFAAVKSRVGVAYKLIAGALLAWLAASVFTNGLLQTSLAWCLDLAVLGLLIVLVPVPANAIANLQRTFLWAAVLMAAYCSVEFLVQRNFLFDPIYAALNIVPAQHWSVYRASGSLGHPLYAGLFFSMAFGVAFGKRLEGGSNKYLLVAGISMLGVLTTVSRNSLGAVAIAAGVIILPNLFRRSSLSPPAKIALAAAVVGGVFGITQASAFQDRLDSDEAQGSTNARGVIVDLAFQVAQASHWIGSGPGSSVSAAAPLNPRGVIIESAYLQLLISVGIPGLLLFALLIAGGVLTAIKYNAYAGLGCLAAYAVSVGFFNVLESSRPTILLLGFALLMAWRDRPIEIGENDPMKPPVGALSMRTAPTNNAVGARSR